MAKGSKTGGRRPGSLNKVTVEAKEFCASIVDDPQYQAKLRARALAGNLPPALEAMIWHYAKGKPKEQVDLSLTERIDARDTSWTPLDLGTGFSDIRLPQNIRWTALVESPLPHHKSIAPIFWA